MKNTTKLYRQGDVLFRLLTAPGAFQRPVISLTDNQVREEEEKLEAERRRAQLENSARFTETALSAGSDPEVPF